MTYMGDFVIEILSLKHANAKNERCWREATGEAVKKAGGVPGKNRNRATGRGSVADILEVAGRGDRGPLGFLRPPLVKYGFWDPEKLANAESWFPLEVVSCCLAVLFREAFAHIYFNGDVLGHDRTALSVVFVDCEYGLKRAVGVATGLPSFLFPGDTVANQPVHDYVTHYKAVVSNAIKSNRSIVLVALADQERALVIHIPGDAYADYTLVDPNTNGHVDEVLTRRGVDLALDTILGDHLLDEIFGPFVKNEYFITIASTYCYMRFGDANAYRDRTKSLKELALILSWCCGAAKHIVAEEDKIAHCAVISAAPIGVFEVTNKTTLLGDCLQTGVYHGRPDVKLLLNRLYATGHNQDILRRPIPEPGTVTNLLADPNADIRELAKTKAVTIFEESNRIYGDLRGEERARRYMEHVVKIQRLKCEKNRDTIRDGEAQNFERIFLFRRAIGLGGVNIRDGEYSVAGLNLVCMTIQSDLDQKNLIRRISDRL